MKLSSVLLAGFAALATSREMNCWGSSLCGVNIGGMGQLEEKLWDIKETNWYRHGKHIVCAHNICCFFQGGIKGGTAGTALKLVRKMRERLGCRKCGSAPVYGDDDVRGMLTCNWVVSPGNS